MQKILGEFSMPKPKLHTIKNCDAIFSNGSDVLICNRKLSLFRRDGTFVSTFSILRNPSKIAFLPNNTALVDGLGDRAYHYISLTDGALLWSSPKKGKRNSMSAHRFAVSPDGITVYDVCHDTANGIYIDRLIPHKQQHDLFHFHGGLRVTRDIFCNENGALCALQSHVLVDNKHFQTKALPSIKQHGILEFFFDKSDINFHWIKQWQSISEGRTTELGCDGKKILREDFSILDLNTMNIQSLLPNTEIETLPKEGFTWSYESDRKLLSVFFISSKLNIIIDCNSHQVVFKCARDDWSVGYQGCLIGSEYWTGTPNGIVKLPFPNMG